METLKNMPGKLLRLVGAVAVGASGAAASRRASARVRKREEEAAMFRAADEEIAALESARTVLVMYVLAAVVSLAAGITVVLGFPWAGWALIGFALGAMGAAWTHAKDRRARYAWVLLIGGALLFIASLITSVFAESDALISFLGLDRT
ncbi:hypothetical protein [Arthrobacter sp. SD76]|uniref:hypothetical protein n=1 Tax=Arthrobacter sp. SD76 TaxID=3415007 RepID=UPI003C7431C9